MTASVYLAGPIQHAADHGKGWRARLKDGGIDHKADVEFIDPLDFYNTHEMEYKEWTSEDVVQKDLEIIAECDAILVHWIEVPTCGSPMEVFYARWIPKFVEAIDYLATALEAEHGNARVNKEYFIKTALQEADLPEWMLPVVLGMSEDIPVVIQTSVPSEEISPWLTHHASALVENFDDALHWIEREVNGGEAPEPHLLDPEYEILTQ